MEKLSFQNKILKRVNVILPEMLFLWTVEGRMHI